MRFRLAALLAISLLSGADLAISQGDYSFMPKGGKTLLLEILSASPDPAEILEIAAAKRSEDEWNQTFASRTRGLSEKEARTLVEYLAVNMPLDEQGQQAAQESADLASVLPRDGRALAWEECQYCHSLFSSHLTQDRDVQAWRNMFASPFHRELEMTAQEREEFSRYSAINMPMAIDDVPEDLRF